jgi:spermidine synthase
MDAAAYLANAAQGATDIIFADLHWSYEVDRHQLDAGFIAACHRVLNDDGWLVMNYFCDDAGKIAGLQALYNQFPVINTCATGAGNLVVYAGKRKPGQNRAALLQAAEVLGKKLRIPLLNHKKKLQGGITFEPDLPWYENI